jgi:uncharacterized coiled-coil DUF342 family protein
MIDIITMHEALRWSGLGPDAPFHATDSSHELKIQKLLSELDGKSWDEELLEEVKSERDQYEGDANELRRDLDQEEALRRDTERELHQAKNEIRTLEDKLAAVAAGAAQ